MSQYHIELATIDDDAALRTVLASTPMHGMISLRFEREPSYFQAAVVDGHFRQVAVVRDTAAECAVGLGCRSVSTRYVNGQPASIGYLSNLRLLPHGRSRGLTARLYAFLRRMHQDGRTPLYLTTIADDNHAAIETLTSGRAGLPMYHAAGSYFTIVFPLTAKWRTRTTCSDVDVRPAQIKDKGAILDFLQTVGPGRQFFPCYQSDDLFQPDGLLSGLRPEDLLLAFRGNRLVGTLGGWDQRAFRQTVIHSYGWPLSCLRPMYNVWAACRQLPRLPRPGGTLAALLGAIPLTADDDPAVLRMLLETLLQKRSGGPWECFCLGMHESDPLLPAIQCWPARRYTTLLYVACWDDGEKLRKSLDSRPFYLELGSL